MNVTDLDALNLTQRAAVYDWLVKNRPQAARAWDRYADPHFTLSTGEARVLHDAIVAVPAGVLA